MNELETFRQSKQNLLDIVDETTDVFRQMEDTAVETTLSELADKLQRDTFKVLVIGEFKRGKSTFINALLHQEILPAYSVPCTAIINEIKLGDDKHAVIHFRKSIGKLPEGLAPDIKDYIASRAGGEIPPLTIPLDRLEEYVTITDVEKEQIESVSEAPFERAEVFLPVDLCRDGVEIIDSPGLNEHGTRSAIANRYAERADAIIFVLLCQPLASETEIESIDMLRRIGHRDIFFICNCFDLLREKDRPKVIQMAKTRLLPRTDMGERGLHFVSSYDALEARTTAVDDAKREELERSSNFPPMEAALRDFLVNDRGRVKLLVPSETVAQKLAKLPEMVAARKAALRKNSEELREKYQKLCESVNDLEQREHTNTDNLSGKISKIEQLIARESDAFVIDVAAKIPGWVSECNPDSDIGLLYSSKEEIENVTRELVAYANKKVKEAQEKWQSEVLMPRLKGSVSDYFKLVGEYRQDFRKRLTQVEREFANAPEEQRGMIVGEVVVRSEMDEQILNDLMISCGVAGVAIGLGMWLVGAVLSPWLIIPAVVGLLIGGGARIEARLNQIKESVGHEMANAIQVQNIENRQTAKLPLIDNLKKEIDSLRIEIKREIDSVKKNAELMLGECGQDEKVTREREQFYDSMLSRASGLSDRNKRFQESLSRRDVATA